MKKLFQKIILAIAFLGLLIPVVSNAARTDALWDYPLGGNYYKTNGSPSGVDVLIFGSNHYLNWGALSGVNGYGIRDNAGIIECKNSGGSWGACGSGGGSGGVSTTSPNIWTALNTFNGGLTIGTLNGPLQANNGVVSATTSVGVMYGGTGITSPPSYGNILVGNSLGGYTLTATSSLGISGGGSAGGVNKNIQFNDSGSFGGLINSVIDNFNGYMGLNEINPFASLDVTARGVTIAPPTAFTLATTTEVLASNVTGTATIINGPADSSGASVVVPTQNDGSGTYFADGSNFVNLCVYGYKLIGGTYYYYGSPSCTSFSDNSDFNNFYLSYSWSSVSNVDGYIIQSYGSANTGNPNFTIDVGNTTSFNDDGTNSGAISLPSSWSSIAYPYNSFSPIADSPGGFSGNNNSGYGSYPDDGTISNVHYDIYAYDNSHSPVYYSNSPVSGDVYPPNIGGNFGSDLSWTSGGSQSGFKIIITVNYVNGDPASVGSYDVGNTTSASNFVANSSDVTVTPTVGSYSLYVTRNYQYYGQKTSPVTSYSPAPTSVSVTDTNPIEGYIIRHDLTYGSTPTAKIVGNTDGTLTAGHITTATSLYETNSGFFTTDSTATPVHYGIVSSGQTQNYRIFSKRLSSLLYSNTYLSGSYTFPNDGVYRFLTLGWTNASGVSDVSILRDTGSGYNEAKVVNGSSLTILSNTTFGDSTTVTPNTIDGPAAIFKNSAKSLLDSATMILRSTDVTTPSARIDFQNAASSTLGFFGFDGGSAKLGITGSTNNFEIYNGGSLSTKIGPFDAMFNGLGNNGFSFLIKGFSGSTLASIDPTATWFPGVRTYLGNNSTDTGSVLTINNTGSNSDNNLYIRTNSAGGTGYAIKVQNQATISQVFSITPDGHISVGQSASPNAMIGIGSGTSSLAPILFTSGTLNSTPQTGAMEYNGTNFYLTPSLTRRQIPLQSSALTSQFYPIADANGLLTNGTWQTISGVINASTLIVEGKAGFSVDSGQTIQMGSAANIAMGQNSRITGNVGYSYVAKTAAYTFGVGDYAVNATSGTFAFTLPTAVGISGREYFMNNAGTGTISINTTSAQTINGNASGVLTMAQFHSYVVMSDGANWIIKSKI